MKPILFYIDPQSYNNLSNYDYGVLCQVSEYNIYYICNKKYDYKPMDTKHMVPLFNYARYTNKVCRGLSYMASLLKIIKLVYKIKPDIIHIQWFRLHKLEFLIYRTFQKHLGIKLVFTMHDIFPRECSENTKHDFVKFYKGCDAIITHTQDSKNNLLSYVPEIRDKAHIIEHGILEMNVNRLEVEKLKQTFRFKYNLANKLIFIHVGGQAKYKGSDLLFDTWINTPVLALNKDIVLIQAGKNYDLKIPDRLPENLILIPRLLEAEEFVAILQLADMAILPYRAIDQSGVILTMINEQTPMCVSKAGELEKIFEIGKVGTVIQSLDQNGIKDAILNLINDKEKLKSYKSCQEEWDKLRQHYDWNRISKQTEKLYLELCYKEQL